MSKSNASFEGQGTLRNPTFIPFLNRFRPGIDSGEKTATLRSRGKYPGEYLITPWGTVLQVLRRSDRAVWDVAMHDWKKEGCSSSDEFVRISRMIHHGRFDPNEIKEFIEFRVVK